MESKCGSPQNPGQERLLVALFFPPFYRTDGNALPPYVLLTPPKEEVDEYVKLTPEEQHKRLKSIIKKIDLDSDGFLTESKDVLHN